MATRSNRNISTNEARSKCNTSFSCHFMSVFNLGDLQGQKVNFKVK